MSDAGEELFWKAVNRMCNAEEENALLRARVEKLEGQVRMLNGIPCTCGSGGHPRRCEAHPKAYQHHVDQMNYESGLLDEIAELKARLRADRNVKPENV